MSRGVVIFWSIFAILISVAVYLYFENTEVRQQYVWEDDEENKRLTVSEFYALSEFLKKQNPDAKVEIVHEFKSFANKAKNDNNAIAFLLPNNTLNTKQGEFVKQWVNKGNHLVYQIGHGRDVFDLAKDTWKKEEKEQENINPQTKARCHQEYEKLTRLYGKLYDYEDMKEESKLNECANNLITFTLPENQDKIYIPSNISGKITTTHVANKIISSGENAEGVKIVRIKEGSGSVTALIDIKIFNYPRDPKPFAWYLKDSINSFDNAYLAAYLTQGKKHIYIINSTNENNLLQEIEPMWYKLFKKAPLLMTIILFFVIATIVYHATHLGGRKNYDNRQTRQISVYLSALGQLIWRNNGTYELLTQWQTQLWQEWQMKLQGYDNIDSNTQINLIHKLTGAAKMDIALWLNPLPTTINHKDLLRYLRAYQRIRKPK
ncbi:MAG: hypothetical protein IK065_01665 [Neisseriaceae bacterium]|nr:hypothetical protein [Neisseriaceae bacterium]